MGLPEKKRPHYTYADYATWDDDKRWELIDGEPCAMAAPSVDHQTIIGELYGQLWQFLKDKPCRVFVAPLDVLLNAEDVDDSDVFQPDIVVICDRSKIIKKGCNGAPDMVIEILSPTTARRDRIKKFNKYLHAGVREYWIVDPDEKTIQVFILENGRYIATGYAPAAEGENEEKSGNDTISVHILEGCTINLLDVFKNVG